MEVDVRNGRDYVEVLAVGQQVQEDQYEHRVPPEAYVLQAAYATVADTPDRELRQAAPPAPRRGSVAPLCLSASPRGDPSVVTTAVAPRASNTMLAPS